VVVVDGFCDRTRGVLLEVFFLEGVVDTTSDEPRFCHKQKNKKQKTKTKLI